MYRYSRPKTLSQILMEWGKYEDSLSLFEEVVIYNPGHEMAPRNQAQSNHLPKSATESWLSAWPLTLQYQHKNDICFSNGNLIQCLVIRLPFYPLRKERKDSDLSRGNEAVWHDTVFRLEMKWICRFYVCYLPFCLKPSTSLLIIKPSKKKKRQGWNRCLQHQITDIPCLTD